MPSPIRQAAVDTRPRMRMKHVVMVPKESVQEAVPSNATRRWPYPTLVFVTVITALLAAIIVAYMSSGTSSTL